MTKRTNGEKSELAKEKNISLVVQQRRKKEILQLAEKIENVLLSDKSTYEKKVDLFNLVKDLEVGESQLLKEQRINYLLESRLYDVLAKRALEEYRKTTVKAFSKAKQL